MLDSLTGLARDNAGGLLVVLVILVIALYVWLIIITGVFGSREKMSDARRLTNLFHMSGGSHGARNRFQGGPSDYSQPQLDVPRHAGYDVVGHGHAHSSDVGFVPPGVPLRHPNGARAASRSRAATLKQNFVGQSGDTGPAFWGPDNGQQHSFWARQANNPDAPEDYTRDYAGSYYADQSTAGGGGKLDAASQPGVGGTMAAASLGTGSAHITESALHASIHG